MKMEHVGKRKDVNQTVRDGWNNNVKTLEQTVLAKQ